MKKLIWISFWIISMPYITYAQSIVPNFTITENTLFKIKEDQVYTFGYLEVPENRPMENGKTIKLPVYIFKSRSKNPKPDPVIVLGGGPGSSMMFNAPYMKYWTYLDDRDLILFEQRGTTYAQPNLACPELSQAIQKSQFPGVSDELALQLKQEAAKACKDRLESENIDLSAYTTTATAADIQDLVEALNIQRYNLYSMSYGTKIAQVLVRDYPAKIRAVVMDSPLPLEVSYDEESITNLMEVYQAIFADCKSDPLCHKRFPDLERDFYAFLKKTNESPIQVKVKNPETQRKESFNLNGTDFISLLSGFSTYNIADIPLNINQIVNNDYALIKTQLQQLFSSSSEGNGLGMRLSVWCAEETAFIDEKVVKEKQLAYPFLPGASPILYEPEVCKIWDVKKVSLKENEAVKSDIPTLIINGSYDSDTPVKWGKQLKANFSNSFHLIIQGYHHLPTTFWENPCVMRAANQFINDPSLKPNLACLKEIGPTKFKLK